MVILFTAYMVDRLVAVIDGAGGEGGWAARRQKCRRSQFSGSRSAGSAPARRWQWRWPYRHSNGGGEGGNDAIMAAVEESIEEEGGGSTLRR